MKRRENWILIGLSRRRARVARVEPLAALAKVQLRDNGERLVELPPKFSGAQIGCENAGSATRSLWARRTVARMLQHAQAHLPPGYRLLVFSAWRSLAEQRQEYQQMYNQLKAEHPRWPENILRRETNRFVHPPDHPVPPGHCTGGAVDLTILGPDGRLLDMTLPQTWVHAPCEARRTAPTFTNHIDPTARKNRSLLISIMSAAGFTNYGGEWWHWSYGDHAWAWRLGRKRACYGAVVDIPMRKRRKAD